MCAYLEPLLVSVELPMGSACSQVVSLGPCSCPVRLALLSEEAEAQGGEGSCAYLSGLM